MSMEIKKPVTLYLSYAQQDKVLKQEFEPHLASLQQVGLISQWIERQVQPGNDWSQVVDPRLLESQLYLVLLSPSLIASGYCSGAEMQAAIERSVKRVVREMLICPIILRHCGWADLPIERFQPMPTNGRPIAFRPEHEREDIWWGIYRELRGLIKNHLQNQE
ncbi:TIR domain-containing protein [Ktedonosporobacter rubrisoli]|uniref:TIR domain-containing protein n=1 Tax=Ktedonosporobacter rubrisoli TaxID=2509675 RepID=A0A4P6JTR2_KTERU|nr:TIR domain-containing protein [Ktedonosporobacter rubrisoli]QBD78979.1 TIR domain-containing protein [Ktedonosporobacter rubrisoli]